MSVRKPFRSLGVPLPLVTRFEEGSAEEDVSIAELGVTGVPGGGGGADGGGGGGGGAAFWGTNDVPDGMDVNVGVDGTSNRTLSRSCFCGAEIKATVGDES
jgi:hypothetical protein